MCVKLWAAQVAASAFGGDTVLGSPPYTVHRTLNSHTPLSVNNWHVKTKYSYCINKCLGGTDNLGSWLLIIAAASQDLAAWFVLSCTYVLYLNVYQKAPAWTLNCCLGSILTMAHFSLRSDLFLNVCGTRPNLSPWRTRGMLSGSGRPGGLWSPSGIRRQCKRQGCAEFWEYWLTPVISLLRG